MGRSRRVPAEAAASGRIDIAQDGAAACTMPLGIDRPWSQCFGCLAVSGTEHVLLAVCGVGDAKWREYEPDDPTHFRSLRLRELGIVESDPKKLRARGTDWRVIAQLGKEPKA